MATAITGQLVLGVAALVAVVVLGVFGVLAGDTVAALLVGLFGGFGLGVQHQVNAGAGADQ